jgi:putative ABC transport system permease protein
MEKLTPQHRSDLAELGTVVVDEGEFWRLGINKVGDSAEVMDKRLRVVGVIHGFKSLAGPYIFCSLDTAKWVLRPPEGQSTFLLARCHDRDDAIKVVDRLNSVHNAPGNVKMVAFTQRQFSNQSQWHWLTKTKAGIALGLAAALGLMVGAVVTSQTLYAATAASMREYAVLRALGIPRWRIARAVLAQAFWVGAAGVLLALPMIYGLRELGHLASVKIDLYWWLVSAAALITMIMAMCSGWFALRSLRSLEPVTLLR